METAASPSFASLLRRHRLAAGLTQEQLAERARLSVRGVSDLERGLRLAPRRDTIDLLADALALSSEDRAAFRASVSRRRGPVLPSTVSSLPAEVTTLIGREEAEAQATHLLRWGGVRLLTFTGPGGVGKTRLAVRVTHRLAGDFADGAALVLLAPIRDPSLVSTRIASALGIREREGWSQEEVLLSHFQRQERLVVLDNFEHLLPAAALLSRLLESCQGLKLLVTSRAPLRLKAEQEMEIPPLDAPLPSLLPPGKPAARSPAATLFVQRARAVRPDFCVSDENAAAVAEICYRLDGLPLAIELAAARTKLFPPGELLRRLEQPLALLTGGAADQATRHRTLRDTIDWSHSLLTAEEQALFARLSVFAGGWTFEAAEAICDVNRDLEVLDTLASLVDKSLVRRRGEDEARFGMLETIRQYAAEKLVQRGEQDLIRDRHAQYFVRLAEEAEDELYGPDQARWLEDLEREHGNLRDAVSWGVETGNTLPMRMATTLWMLSEVRGHLTEGRRWLEAMLTIPERDEDAALRGKALTGAGNLAVKQGDLARARELHEEALGLRRRIGDTSKIAASLLNLGRVARRQGEFREAEQLFEESLYLYEELGDLQSAAQVLNSLGIVVQGRGNYERAAALYEDSLQFMREAGDTRGIAIALCNLAHVTDETGQPERARQLYAESIEILRDLGDRGNVAVTLIGLACVEAHLKRDERSMRILGAADAIAASIGLSPEPWDYEIREFVIREAGSRLSGEDYASSWNRGAAMTMDEAIEFALDECAAV